MKSGVIRLSIITHRLKTRIVPNDPLLKRSQPTIYSAFP